jgi:polyisoprenoid-binding protein YceI
MSTATTPELTTTPGTYTLDPVHSSVTFSVRHFGAGKFRGSFNDFDANLTAADDGSLALRGEVKVASVHVKEPKLAGHLLSPDFFDAERYPEISFQSTRFEVSESGELHVHGDLTLKGTTKNVHATGEINVTDDDGYGGERVGVELTTTIDRKEFGVSFDATLPGGQAVVADEVTLQIELELIKAKA